MINLHPSINDVFLFFSLSIITTFLCSTPPKRRSTCGNVQLNTMPSFVSNRSPYSNEAIRTDRALSEWAHDSDTLVEHNFRLLFSSKRQPYRRVRGTLNVDLHNDLVVDRCVPLLLVRGLRRRRLQLLQMQIQVVQLQLNMFSKLQSHHRHRSPRAPPQHRNRWRRKELSCLLKCPVTWKGQTAIAVKGRAVRVQ